MINFVALRIICYVESDKKLIQGILSDNFTIVKEESKANGYKAIYLDVEFNEEKKIARIRSIA